MQVQDDVGTMYLKIPCFGHPDDSPPRGNRYHTKKKERKIGKLSFFLQGIYIKFGRVGLVLLLSQSALSTNSPPSERMTRNSRIEHTIDSVREKDRDPQRVFLSRVNDQ